MDYKGSVGVESKINATTGFQAYDYDHSELVTYFKKQTNKNPLVPLVYYLSGIGYDPSGIGKKTTNKQTTNPLVPLVYDLSGIGYDLSGIGKKQTKDVLKSSEKYFEFALKRLRA